MKEKRLLILGSVEDFTGLTKYAVERGMPLHEAVSLMNTKDILYLPVVDEEMHLKGMLTMPNLLSLFDDNVLSEQR